MRYVTEDSQGYTSSDRIRSTCPITVKPFPKERVTVIFVNVDTGF